MVTRSDSRRSSGRGGPLTWPRIALAWLAMMGVDLLFHAGLFAGVFDQSREPSLLPDEVLFRRIPVAYATLLVAAVALAWVLDRADQTGRAAQRVGATAGLAVGVMGLGALWTAVDITGLLVAAGTVVLIAQGWAAAIVLTWPGENRALTRRVVGLVIAAIVAGQVTANVLG